MLFFGDGDDFSGDGIDFGEAFDAVVGGHFPGGNRGPEHERKLGYKGGEVAVISTVHEGADAIHAAFFEKDFDDFPVGRIPSEEDALYGCGRIRHENGKIFM